MTGNGRGTMRPQGRTPPFMLIGLLVVLCILGFSYWNASSRSSDQAAKITILQDEVRVLSTRKMEAEKRSESTNNMLRDLEKAKEAMQTRLRDQETSLQEANTRAKNIDDELQSIRNEIESKKESLNKCEQDAVGIQQELQKIKEESESLKQDVANKPATCDQNACEEPIKNILNILVNSLGRQQIISTLQNNNIQDIEKLISADAGVQAGQQAPAKQANPPQPGANPANLQQPAGNVANQQPPPVNPGDLQLAANPANQQQPVVNPADQVPGQPGVGQVQPPKDAANPGQQNVVKMVGSGSNTTRATTSTTAISESGNVSVVKPATNDSHNKHGAHGEGNREVPGSKVGDDNGKDKVTEGTNKDKSKDTLPAGDDKKSETVIPVTTSSGKRMTDGNTSTINTTVKSQKDGNTTEKEEDEEKMEGADAANKIGEEKEEEDMKDEEDEKPLKFEPNNLPHLDVAQDNDAIDRMNENMALDDRKPALQ